MRVSVILPLLLVLASCRPAEPVSNNTVTPPPPPPPGIPRTWLALGDSYTIGQGVDAGDRFPAQTVNLLRQKGINMGLPDYIAVTGWTSTALKNEVNRISPVPHDVVSLLIGVNDQYQTSDTTGYRDRFTWLLEKAIVLTGGKKERVCVLSIPDYSVTPFASFLDTARIRREIDWFNAINRDVTTRYQCPYFDITPSTREARYDRSLLANDGLHPSALEYRKWAERLTPVLEPLLR